MSRQKVSDATRVARSLARRWGAGRGRNPSELYGAYADSWRVTQATSLLDYGPGQTTDTFTDRTFPGQYPTKDLTLANGTVLPTNMPVLVRVRTLYAIEAEIRGHPAEHRRAVRQERSRPIVEVSDKPGYLTTLDYAARWGIGKRCVGDRCSATKPNGTDQQ